MTTAFTNIRCLVLSSLCMACVLTASAQSGTNSPYSQYGWGALSDQTSGFNRGMNGIGIGLRDGRQVNFLNPASYSAMDSLMFLFDAGVSGHLTQMKEGDKQITRKNANFEYAVAGFRVARHLGVSFGIIPFSNVGYSYATTLPIGSSTTSSYTNTYTGSGGLRQVYVGAGWEPFRGLSVGFNAAYVWGDYEKWVINSYSDTYINKLSKVYKADVNTYKLDFGLQYQARVAKDDYVTVGLTYALGHKMKADPTCIIYSTNSQTGISDTTRFEINEKLSLPHSFGAALAWNHGSRWKVGIDYTMQKWSSVSFPEYKIIDNQPQYKLNTSYFDDRHKVNLGGEYCNDVNSRSFMKRIRYRAGASYASSYFKVNGKDGPSEVSVSAGVGVPIVNNYNNRSILNVSVQWVRNAASGLLTENTFRLNIGLTFNERWFQKWKFD